jgi:AhpD family alkylhydroperoxidase
MDESVVPNAMKVLTAVTPEGARSYLDHKSAVMENPALQALPAKYKLLVGIGVAAALRSGTCALMWTRMATEAGATEGEIAEAILVARLMTMATVNSAAEDAFAWLDGGV